MTRRLAMFIFCIGISTHLPYAEALSPINILRPWDINFRPQMWFDRTFYVTAWAEGTTSLEGVNGRNQVVSPLQIWQPDQNALAMLSGFPENSPMTQKLNVIGYNTKKVLDDGVRGHMDVKGKFKYNWGFGLNGRYQLPHNFILSAYVPFYSMQLSNVEFIDKTGFVTDADIAVRENLTNNFAEIVQTLDPNLNLTGWKRQGVGDVIIMGEWYRSFPQPKPILKNVTLDARLGFMLPTGVKTDVNDIFSMPFGYDGSTSMIFGAGIDVTWWNLIKGGFDVELIYAFGNTRLRRIKTATDQTELLLLAVAPAHKDVGFVRRYNIYAEASNVVGGLSARAAYEYWHQGESKLYLATNLFSNQVANTAESLQEWTIHQAIFIVTYDFTEHLDECAIVTPQLSLFFKFPFNGQRAILANTGGATFTLCF